MGFFDLLAENQSLFSDLGANFCNNPITLGDQRKRQTLFQAIQADFFCTCNEIIAPACGHRNIWL